MPLKICDHWECDNKLGCTESRTKVCQFSGFVILVIATFLAKDNARTLGNLIDIASITINLSLPSGEIYWWLSQQWGDTGASQGIRLFTRSQLSLI